MIFEISGRTGGRRHGKLDHRVVAERAVGIEPDRPDLQPVGYCVVEPLLEDGEPENAALRRRIVPGRRLGAVELRAGDVQAGRRCPGHRRQTLRRASGDAVVVAAKLAAVQAVAVDQAGFAIGDEQRFGVRIVDEAAERGAGIAPATERDIGEQADLPGRAVDLPDRSGSALRAPQAGHESRVRRADLDVQRLAVRARRDNRQSIGRRCRRVDIGRRTVVERDAEHLADQRGGEGERLRCADELRLRRAAHVMQIDDAQRRPVRIDESLLVGIDARRDLNRRQGAGEAGHGGVAGEYRAAPAAAP